MAFNDPLSTRSPADDLLERLEEPAVVAALNTLLDHADVLALALVALDGFLSRGDVIANALADAAVEFRGVSIDGGPLAGVDIKAVARTVASLSGPLVAATPALTELIDRATDPKTLEVANQLTTAVVEGGRNAANTPPPGGAFALLRTLKDPDVARGIGFFTEVAKAFGRQRA